MILMKIKMHGLTQVWNSKVVLSAHLSPEHKHPW